MPPDHEVLIRPEKPQDWTVVHALNTSAFDTRAEADLVDTLRQQAHPCVSLVAEAADLIVGHIMFTPVVLSGHPDLRLMGLAPLAVAISHRQRGIGAALVRAGLDRCKQIGFGAVVVLGHAKYYPRFGFVPSVRFGITSEYDVPDDVFMVVEVEPGYLDGASGMVKYHAAFGDL